MTAVETQGLLEVFEPPYRSKFREHLIWCGCCQREGRGYDAIHNGHNACHGRNRRGLGCECTGMMLTLNHVWSYMRDAHETSPCYCSGDPGHVHGSGRKHKGDLDHHVDQLVHYWIPRAFRAWPPSRHAALRQYIDALARYYGLLDHIRGDS